MKKILAITLLSLAFPAGAHAGVPAAPIGQVICSATECFTVEATDTILLAYANDPAYVWDIRRYHAYRHRTPYVHMVYASGGDSELILHNEARNTPDCNPTGENAGWMDLYPGLKGTGYIANSQAPQGFIDACHLLTAEQAAAVVAAQRPSAPAPTAAAACAPIVYGKKKVAVTSRSVACAPARNIIARYLRSGAEPRDYVCVSASLGRVRAVTCAKPARSRAAAAPRITGRWRV